MKNIKKTIDTTLFKSKKFWILSSVSAFLIFCILFCYFNLYSKLPIDKQVIVTIPSKISVDSAITILNKYEICKPTWFFKTGAKLYAYIFGRNLIAGTYLFNKDNTDLHALIAIFTGRQQYIVKITYPEGINLRQFAGISARKLGIDSAEFIKIAFSDSLLKARKIPAKSIEGYLMPATYQFHWQQPVIEVIDKLLEQQDKIWSKSYESQAKEQNISRHQVLTLASIIEAETASINERPRVSGVYHNRIDKNWKLEADPTVNYAIGEKRKLYFKDLEYDSPYNTYKYTGLPPGPINSPSKSSISAALNPEKHEYMFFVAVGDGSGTHNFSRTMAEHKKNIVIYKQNLSQRGK